MVQTKFDGQRNGNRFGGDKAWRQHRYDGEYSNTDARNAANQRQALLELEQEALSPHGDDFSGNPLEFFTPDSGFPVSLRLDGAGRVVSAHCG